MDSQKAFEIYKQAFSSNKIAAFWDKALPWVGRAAGMGAGYGLSNATADTIGIDSDTRKLPVALATVLGAFTGGNTMKALRDIRAAKAVGDPVLAKNLSDAAATTIKKNLGYQLGTDLGLGGGTGLIKSWKQNLDAGTQKINNEIQGAGSSIKSGLESFPGGIPGAVAAGVLSLTGALALANISRAAGRVGSGKVIRVSTSLRKRPGQLTDINFGVMPFNAKNENLNPALGRLPSSVLDTGEED